MNAVTELEERRQALRAEFAELTDGFDRYAYLVELAALLPPYPEDRRTDDRLVRGCQSRVWLYPYAKDGRFYFSADSDTLIIRGVLLVLQDLLCGVTLEEAAGMEIWPLSDMGLAEQFTDVRRRGLGEAVAVLRRAAAALLDEA